MKTTRILALVSAALLLCAGAVSAKAWRVPGDFATIQAAVDDAAVEDGDTIRVGRGAFAGALIDKSVAIQGVGQTIIDSGPIHSSGLVQGFRLLAGSDGSTFSHLTFEVDFGIMNADGVDDVSVVQCRFRDAVQAVSDWRGSGWQISHNKITDLRTRCGGGIGILVGDFSGGVTTDNVVSHNTVTGVLRVDPNDCGGYNGTGIVLFADYRFGRSGASDLAYNRVVKNKVAMASDTPSVVDVVAFEITDTRDDLGADPYPVIYDNAVGFNDWRGTALQMVFTPDDLESWNDVSRNLGNNRGHGLHPSVFGPGGH